MRPGLNPTRRNRNIGTSKQGHGRDNRMKIPSICNYERIWWEQLGRFGIERRLVLNHELVFITTETSKNYIHSCSVDDICRILSALPPQDWEGLYGFIFRQSTRKQRLSSPSWGRLAYDAQFGRPAKPNVYSGPALILEAINPTERSRWNKSLSPSDLEELERLSKDGHTVIDKGKYFEILSNPDSIRSTQLYRTVLHEIGHWQDWLQKVKKPAEKVTDKSNALEDAYFSRPHEERETFAHRYADAARHRLLKEGVIPFAKSTKAGPSSGDSPPNTTEYLKHLDHLKSDPFMADGRRQPKTPKRKIFK